MGFVEKSLYDLIGKTQEKALQNAQEEAQRQKEEAAAQAEATRKRIEEATGLTPQELEREQRLFGVPEGEEPVKLGQTGLEQSRQDELTRRAGLSGEDLLREAGPNLSALLDIIYKRQGMTGEELFRSEGDINRALQERVLSGAQQPGGSYEDTLNQQLELARQMVNAEANRRGVFGGQPEGGIRFEQLGRAGVDLAVKSAADRQAARQQDLANASALASQFLDLSGSARGEGATVGQAALSEQQQARGELEALLANLQSLTSASRGRAAQGVVSGAQITAPIIERGRNVSTDIMTDVYGVQLALAEKRRQEILNAIKEGASQAATAGGGGIPAGGGATAGATSGSNQGLAALRSGGEVPNSDIIRLRSSAGYFK